MTRSRTVVMLAVAGAVAMAAVGFHLAGSRSRLDAHPVPQEAIDRAVQALTAQQESLDPILAIILDSIRRRFELTAVPSQRPYVDAQQQAAQEAGTVMRTGDPLANMLAIFRRLMDPSASATAAEVEALRMPIDQVTAMAIHCQAVPLPADYFLTLDEMVDLGGYALTHAVIAGQWLLENGCAPEATIAERRQRYLEALVRQIDKEEGLLTDRRVEAMATLFYLGAGEHARSEWIDFVLQRQLPDGQWPGYANQPQTPNAHTTLMALWLLLEARSVGSPSRIPMMAQPDARTPG